MTTTTKSYGAWPQVWRVPEEQAPKYIALLKRQLMGAFNLPSPPSVRRAYECGLTCLRATETDLTPLPLEAQDAFRMCCQHRMEILWGDGPGQHFRGDPFVPALPGLVVYDGRAMYLGVASLPIGAGPVRHVTRAQWLDLHVTPNDRGRVRVRFTVPRAWRHVGLLAVPPGDGSRWRWPNEPGYEGETWCDCAELRLAESQLWRVEVQEAWFLQRAAPLAPWAGRLETLYTRALRAGDKLLARLYRDIAIITLGELHSRGMRVQRTMVQPGHEELIAPGEEWSWDVDRYAVYGMTPRDKAPDTFHPEWTAAVWSYTHYRITSALLSVPRERIVGVRGDAVFLTEPAPGWVDSGKPGSLRFQGHLAGPVPAPRAFDPDLSELARRARG